MLAHLQTALQFKAVMQASRQRVSGCMVQRHQHLSLHFACTQALLDVGFHQAAEQRVWVGVIAPKRQAKRALTRNTVKRLFYAHSEAENRNQALRHGAYILYLHAALKSPEFISASSPLMKRVLRAEIGALFQRIDSRQSKSAS